ncbi:hypothetical protein [Microcystis sp. M076S1]|uniref:hypothetical protein n=1 Tax=Microcystis sp. M076S1 TaxID=2771127 RepID=UPI00258B8875|nr:hypothetical protein [Microcystis sp. M076S1]
MGKWGRGGISTKTLTPQHPNTPSTQHPPQRARSDHPNTLTPQHPKTPTANKNIKTS